ncbi:hypothetical protein PHET_04897, partial [Paragonimus heterotremus]
IPAVLKRASPLHYDALITCTQKNELKNITDKTYIELFFHRQLYTPNVITSTCINELAQNLSVLLNSGIDARELRVIVHSGSLIFILESCLERTELEFMYFVSGYRLYTHPVITLQEGTGDNSATEFSYFDEKLLSELQTDFEINWVPKFVALHSEHPLAVQLCIDEFGLGTQPVSKDVTFDVFYNGTVQLDNSMFLIETVININQLRQASIYSEDESYIEAVIGNTLLCLIFINDV